MNDSITTQTSWSIALIECLEQAPVCLDCKTAVFLANAGNGPYSNDRLERVKKRRGRMITLTALPAFRKRLFCSLQFAVLLREGDHAKVSGTFCKRNLSSLHKSNIQQLAV